MQKLILTFLILILTVLHVKAQCMGQTQSEFEHNFSVLTNKYLEKYNPLGSEQEKSQYVDKYVKDVKKILCYNSSLTFKGNVIEIDSLWLGKLYEFAGRTEEIADSVYAESRYLLKISNEYEQSSKLFKYDFSFGTNSPLANKILNLKPGDNIKYTFRFSKNNPLHLYLEAPAMLKALGKEADGPTFIIEIEEVDKL